MKTLLSDTSGASLLAPPDRRSCASPKRAARACPPRSHHNSLFTGQSTPRPEPARGRDLWLLRTRPPGAAWLGRWWR